MKSTSRFIVPFVFLTFLVFAGCKDKAPGNNGAKGPHFTKADPGPGVGGVKLQIVSPKEGEVITADSMLLSVKLDSFDLMAPSPGEQSKGIAYSRDGQMIHVIVDDKPFVSMTQTDSFPVGKLNPGVHTVRAFPARSWHESIKVPGAFALRTFYIRNKTGDTTNIASAPTLTYNVPTGDYTGEDAGRILLDFYVSNAELGSGKYSIQATLDNSIKETITSWAPYYLDGLAAGTHSLKLQLLDASGKPVPGAFNSVERTFTVHNPPPARKAVDSAFQGS